MCAEVQLQKDILTEAIEKKWGIERIDALSLKVGSIPRSTIRRQHKLRRRIGRKPISKLAATITVSLPCFDGFTHRNISESFSRSNLTAPRRGGRLLRAGNVVPVSVQYDNSRSHWLSIAPRTISIISDRERGVLPLLFECASEDITVCESSSDPGAHGIRADALNWPRQETGGVTVLASIHWPV